MLLMCFLTFPCDWSIQILQAKVFKPLPCFLAPYTYKLDWQLWFAAYPGIQMDRPWVMKFVEKLIAGDKQIIGLLPGKRDAILQSNFQG